MRSVVHMIETIGIFSDETSGTHERNFGKKTILWEAKTSYREKKRRPVIDYASICLIFYFSFVLRAKKKSSEHILLF